MIRWIPERRIQPGRITLPGDIRRRAAHPGTERLAKMIELGTCSRVPVLRKQGRRLTPIGCIDVLAAHIRLQSEDVLCRMFEASDQEAEIVRIGCELEEKEHSKEAEQALVAKVEALREELSSAPVVVEKGRPGRKRSPLGRALAETAKITGISERKIRRIHQEARLKDKLFADDSPPALEAELQTWGMRSTLSPEYLQQVGRVQYLAVAIRDYTRKAVRLAEQMAKEKLPVPDPWFERLVAKLRASETEADGFVPLCLCAWCKGIAGVQENCPACSTKGWNSKAQSETIPDTLRDPIDRIVIRAGEPVRVADLVHAETGEE